MPGRATRHERRAPPVVQKRMLRPGSDTAMRTLEDRQAVERRWVEPRANPRCGAGTPGDAEGPQLTATLARSVAFPHPTRLLTRMPSKISLGPGVAGGSLRRIAIGVAVLVGLGVLANATTTRIDAGHVGIKVNLAGSARGVQEIPVVTGWVFYNPLTEQIVAFPAHPRLPLTEPGVGYRLRLE